MHLLSTVYAATGSNRNGGGATSIRLRISNLQRMDLFKQLLVFGSIVVSTQAVAQISTGKVEEKKPEAPKAEKPRRVPTDGTDEFVFYLGAGRVYANRTLTSNVEPFGAPLGDRGMESSLKAWSFQGGIRNRVNKYISYDVGLSLDRFGESYSYEDTGSDSTFSYDSRYSYYAIPIQVLATYGKDFRFFLGGGIEPQLLAGFRQDQKWTTKLNSVEEETVKSTNGFNQFNFGVLATCGIQWRLGTRSSLYVMPTWMWNLTSTYDDQADYVHKAYTFNLKFGLAFHLKQ
jgi:hypothetical protein